MPDIKQPFVILSPFTPMPNVDGSNPHRSNLVDTLFTLNIPTGCEEVMVQALTQNIRYTLNGTNPTAASGFLLTAGDPAVVLPVTKNTVLKFISATAGAILEHEFGE
jgi:hypothetical protein